MLINEIKKNKPNGATHCKLFSRLDSYEYLQKISEGLYMVWFKGNWCPLPYQYFSNENELIFIGEAI